MPVNEKLADGAMWGVIKSGLNHQIGRQSILPSHRIPRPFQSGGLTPLFFKQNHF
jgi:hypothetical protein